MYIDKLTSNIINTRLTLDLGPGWFRWFRLTLDGVRRPRTKSLPNFDLQEIVTGVFNDTGTKNPLLSTNYKHIYDINIHINIYHLFMYTYLN